jgi:hypothetical protein
LKRDSGVQPVVSVHGGNAIATHAYPVVGAPSRWRLIVDVAGAGADPAIVRASLKRGSDALTETLIYSLGNKAL